MASTPTIITNITSPIGEACARICADAGRRLILSDPHEDQGRAIAEGLSSKSEDVIFLHADAANKLDVHNVLAEALESFGHVSALIHNAIPAAPSAEGDSEEDEFEPLFKSSVYGTNLINQAVAKQFARQRENAAPTDNKSPSIVNITSANASVTARPVMAAIEGAITEMTRALALEIAEFGGRANTIAVGAAMGGLYSSEQLKAIQKISPLGRVGDADDVGEAAAFMTSDAASFLTGQTVKIDGGGLTRLSRLTDAVG